MNPELIANRVESEQLRERFYFSDFERCPACDGCNLVQYGEVHGVKEGLRYGKECFVCLVENCGWRCEFICDEGNPSYYVEPEQLGWMDPKVFQDRLQNFTRENRSLLVNNEFERKQKQIINNDNQTKNVKEENGRLRRKKSTGGYFADPNNVYNSNRTSNVNVSNDSAGGLDCLLFAISVDTNKSF